MDPNEQFRAERLARVGGFGSDREFRKASNFWLQHSVDKQYVYDFDWLGRPIIQYPQDIVAIQELIWSVKPDLVIETGIAHGGSLILSASMLALLDYADAVAAGTMLDPGKPKRKVLGIDIDIRAHNRTAIESHPMSGRIEMIEGSSIDAGIISRVAERASAFGRVLVALDSNHTEAHVLAELEGYAPLTSVGSYCVVFDTFVEDLSPNSFPNRSWAVGDNPKTAVQKFVARHPEFRISPEIPQKLMITAAPDGFLQRVR